MTSALLQSLLAPLNLYLKRPDVIECSVNQPGEICLETTQGYTLHQVPSLDKTYWRALCQVLANERGLTFHPLTQPRLSVMLPEGHRLEALMGAAVDSALSISIRLRRSLSLKLEDFGLVDVLKERLQTLLHQGANLLISGGTSSGKTTLMNTLIQSIPLDQRVLVLEDTRELTVPHANHQYYVVSRNEKNPLLDYPQLIDHLMRSRPDVILLGELSMANAYPMLRLLNSGHQGFLCTLHANTPELALAWAIPQNITFAGHPSRGVTDFLYHTVDAVIQVHKTPKGQRQVTEVFFPKTRERVEV